MAREPSTHPILIGTSGWSYADWVGPFYPSGSQPADYLEHYADRFPIVEVDSTFYRPPALKMVRGWRERTPDDFRFALKVPRVITHDKLLKDCRLEVEGFIKSILPLGPKMACCLLQMGYFNKSAFASQNAFLETLDEFLAGWPVERVPLAVEIRNARWLNEEFADVLRRRGAALVLTDQLWMPRPSEVVAKFDVLTGPFAFLRLLGDREGIEKVTTTWDKIVVERSEDLKSNAEVMSGLAERAPVYAFVTNHYAGHAPETVRQLEAILGIEEPPPPPRTTLFD